MKVFSVLAAFSISLSCAATLAQEALLPSLASYKVGETWEWSERLVENSNPTKAKMESFDIREVIVEQGEKKFLKKNAYGSQTSAIDEESKSTEKPLRKWPLKVGAKWVFEDHWTSGDGTTGLTVSAAPTTPCCPSQF